MPLNPSVPWSRCLALFAVLCATPALAAHPPAAKPAARRPAPAVEELPGPGWRLDENETLEDGPITPVASISNDEGFVFAVYGRPQAFVKFRLEIPAPGLELRVEQPLSLQVDARIPMPVIRDANMNQILGWERVTADPRWVQWEFDPPFDGSESELVVYQLRAGRSLRVTLNLADGTTRTTDFGLRGARERLGIVAPAYDAAYVRRYDEYERRIVLERGIQDALHAGEARCGHRAGDHGPPCALALRDCIVEYSEFHLTPERGRALLACLRAVPP